MLSSVLALITCTAIPVNEPLAVPAQMSPASPAVEAGMHVTGTSFQCRNFSSTNYVLVFGQSGTSATVAVPLPPNASVAYGFSAESLQGVFVEAVAVRSSANMLSSGSIALGMPANSNDESLWFVPGNQGLVTWRQLGCEVEIVQPGGTLLSNVQAASTEESTESSAAQIPSGVPTGPASNTPPPQSLPPM